MGILERIADIENEINRTQKNKGSLLLAIEGYQWKISVSVQACVV